MSTEKTIPPWEWDDPNTTADKPARPRLRVWSAAEAMAEPPPQELVQGIAWAGCVTVLVAESSAGKTFVGLDLAAAISAGYAWHGRATTQGSVVHIGYESDAIGLRLRALHDHRKARLEHVYRIRANAPLSPLVSRSDELPSGGEVDVTLALESLQAALNEDEKPPLSLVIFDTVRASMTGSEDSSESVSAYLRAIRRMLATVPGAGALLIHHAGWQDGDVQKKRERGSSAFRGNVDATLYLQAGEYDPATESAPLTLLTHKVRDGERPGPIQMVRQRVTFTDTDTHGKPLSSCVIDPDPKTASDHDADKRAKTAADDAVLDRRILTAILQHPEATSQAKLRVVVGCGKMPFEAGLARLFANQLIGFPVKERQPYTVTEHGRAFLASS